jgi:hypothetical protein
MREGLIYLPFISDDDCRRRRRNEARAIDHIRWTLWNGCECVYATDCAITEFRLELDAHATAALAARHSDGLGNLGKRIHPKREGHDF